MSRQLADFATEYFHDRLSPSVETQVRHALLDTCGCIVAARSEPRMKGLCDWAAAHDIAETTVTSQMAATVTLGTLARALDFDDMSYGMWGHPSAVLASTLLPFGLRPTVTAEQIFKAYAAAYVAMSEVGKVCAAQHFHAGWHNTSTLGAMGAAIGAGLITGLTRAQLSEAIGLSVSGSAGLQANTGSMCLALYAGTAAWQGVQSAFFAGLGVDTRRDIFEGRRGFFETFGGAKDLEFGESLTPKLSAHRDGLLDGPVPKVLPSCAATHPAAEAALEIVGRTGTVEPGTVESVECTIADRAYHALVHTLPTDSMSARSSCEYAVAVSLVDGALTAPRYTASGVASALAGEVGGMIKRIAIKRRETVEDSKATLRWENETATVVVRFRSGAELSASAGHPKLSLGTSEGRARVVAKYAELTRPFNESGHATRVQRDLLHGSIDTLTSSWQWIPTLWTAA